MHRSHHHSTKHHVPIERYHIQSWLSFPGVLFTWIDCKFAKVREGKGTEAEITMAGDTSVRGESPGWVARGQVFAQKNVRNPNHHYFSKKVSQYTSNLYCSMPPICIAVHVVPYSLRKGKYCQYSPLLYRSTPPICIAIRLPFASQCCWRILVVVVTGMCPIYVQYTENLMNLPVSPAGRISNWFDHNGQSYALNVYVPSLVPTSYHCQIRPRGIQSHIATYSLSPEGEAREVDCDPDGLLEIRFWAFGPN